MELTAELKDLITTAEQKVLATASNNEPNVVPLSMVEVYEDKIVICNCFMDKTIKNLESNDKVALAFWKGFVGIQVKGRVAYETEGQIFDSYVDWLAGKHPDRVLKGVLVVTPESVYDLAPSNAGARLV